MLTVEFIGICTHILPDEHHWPRPHRVVLPRSRHGHMEHEGFLVIPKNTTTQDVRAFADAVHPGLAFGETADAYKLSLRGVDLWIDNASDKYTVTDTFRCGIFHASDFANGQPLGAPNPDVASKRLEARSHAYFDIASGTLSARLYNKQSSVGVLNVATDGPAQLKAKSFRNNSEAMLVLDGDVPSPLIQLTHITHEWDDRHFILHFELASNAVADPRWPTEPAECLGKDGGGELPGLGPGCSNSTFP